MLGTDANFIRLPPLPVLIYICLRDEQKASVLCVGYFNYYCSTNDVSPGRGESRRRCQHPRNQWRASREHAGNIAPVSRKIKGGIDCCCRIIIAAVDPTRRRQIRQGKKGEDYSILRHGWRRRERSPGDAFSQDVARDPGPRTSPRGSRQDRRVYHEQSQREGQGDAATATTDSVFPRAASQPGGYRDALLSCHGRRRPISD